MDANTQPNDAATPTIVILGGSYAGISTAHQLLQHTLPSLRRYGNYRVVLVSASKEILCRPACPRAMISDDFFDQRKLFVPVEGVFERYDEGVFEFVHGSVVGVEFGGREVRVERAGEGEVVVGFCALVIATGASTASPLMGLSGDAEALRGKWREFRGALKTARKIVIAGGGPAGVEAAGELGEFLNGRAGWFGKSGGKKVEIIVVTAGERILPLLRPAFAEKAERMLERVGVDVVKGVRVENVEPEDAGTAAALTSAANVRLSDGRVLKADLYIPAVGTKPNTSFLPTGLLAKDGRVKTNAANLRVDEAGPHVYALGDASDAARPAVHNILDAVPVLGRTVKRDLLSFTRGHQESMSSAAEKPFTPDDGETQLVPIGRVGGVGAMKGWKLPSWAVWLIKGRDYWIWTTGRLWSGKMWEKAGCIVKPTRTRPYDPPTNPLAQHLRSPIK